MTRFALGLGALTLAVACAQTTPTYDTTTAPQPARDAQVIQINDASVMPSTARVKAGGSVTFSNDSGSGLMAVVRFPSGIKGKLTCKEPLRPDWQYVADGIESIPMSSDSENVVFPCALQAGTYPFVARMFGTLADMDNPQFQIQGTIVVE